MRDSVRIGCVTCYMTRSELMTEEVDIKLWGTATVTTVILLVLGMWNSVLAQKPDA